MRLLSLLPMEFRRLKFTYWFRCVVAFGRDGLMYSEEKGGTGATGRERCVVLP